MKRVAFNKWCYIILAVLTLALAALSVYSTVTGDSEPFFGAGGYVIFGGFALILIAGIFAYRPSSGLYGVGFYFLHAGLPLMLAGFLLYALLGQSLQASVPIDQAGNYYNTLLNQTDSQKAEPVDLGFGFRIEALDIEYYPSGAEKMYTAKINYIERNKLTNQYIGTGSEAELKVNKTFRNNGWKMYLMSVGDHDRSSGGEYYLLPYDVNLDGTLTPRPVEDTFVGDSGSDAFSKLIAGNKYGASSLDINIYDQSSDTYVRAGIPEVSALRGRTVIRVFRNNSSPDGGWHVYVSPSSVLILLKRDPGEYFVLAGMGFTVLGTVLMLFFKPSGARKKAAKKDDPTENRSPEATAKETTERKGGDKK